MKVTAAARSLGALVSLGVLAACGPSALPLGPAHDVAAAMPDARGPAAARGCGLAKQPLPGRYVIMQSQGVVTNGVYHATDGVWEAGTVSATTQPSPTSEPNPPRKAVYLYVGQYHLDRYNQTGCAYLVTTQNGDPIQGKDSGDFDLLPSFGHVAFSVKPTIGGVLTARAVLTASGGHGVIALSTKNGLADKGTVTFSARILEKDFASLRDATSAGVQPNYAFSCDSKNYVYKTVQAAKPGTARGFGFDPRASGVIYVERFGLCAVENSLLGQSDVTSAQSYAFAHGAITYSLQATFSASFPWANNPDVAVWEEAYWPDGTRYSVADIHLALVRVR